jgi:hypothetical protein
MANLRSSLLVLSIVASGCGSAVGNDDFEYSVGQTSDASPADSGSFALEEDVGFSVGCKPECAAGEVCTPRSVCLPKGTCEVDVDCVAGTVCKESKCVPGGACGAEEITATQVPPNLLIVLDRSCSMRRLIGASTKWSIAVKAITALTTKFNGKIRFGLTLFPERVGESCVQDGPVPVSPGEGTVPKIQKLLTNALSETDTNYPSGPCDTNIDTAMKQAKSVPELADASRERYVVLVSDGAQAGCESGGGDVGTEKMINALRAMGVKTAVVGFGSSVDGAMLTRFALAGGMPAPATTYYRAEDAASLEKVLGSIGSAAMPCSFALAKPPPDATKIFAFFDDTRTIVRDDPNGFVYTAATNTVVFQGAACADLKGGKVKDLDIVFGCNMPSPT